MFASACLDTFVVRICVRFVTANPILTIGNADTGLLVLLLLYVMYVCDYPLLCVHNWYSYCKVYNNKNQTSAFKSELVILWYIKLFNAVVQRVPLGALVGLKEPKFN
jgi:hypothetical protein